MHQEESPAELFLFAHCEIKEMAQKKKNSKRHVKSAQGNRTCILNMSDKETT